MADWLPLVMPRPNLFEHFNFPDLAPRDRPEILEAAYDRGTAYDASAVALCTARKGQAGPGRRSLPAADVDEALYQAATSSKVHTAFLSLPIVANAWVFSGGCSDGTLENGKSRSGALKAISARSFISWHAGPDARPLYRLDLMNWLGNLPVPDFSGLPGQTPVQLIIPFERPSLNAHRRITLASRLDEDLAVLGQVYGWGTPYPPRHIQMPAHFA